GGCVPRKMLITSTAAFGIMRRSFFRRRRQVPSTSKNVPELPPHDQVSIAPGALAEELNRRIRVADEGPQHPSHLNADEAIDHQPRPQQPAVARITRDQRAIVFSQE